VVVDDVVDVATVAADVVTGTDGPDAVTVATEVVTAVLLGTVADTVAVGDVTVAVGEVTVAVGLVTVAVGLVTVAVGDVTVAVGDVTVVTIGTVTVSLVIDVDICVLIDVDSVTVGSPIAPGWLPASTFAPKKPANARQTSAMTARRVTTRSRPDPPVVVPPQWARFLSPSTYILARSGHCRNPVPAHVQGKYASSGPARLPPSRCCSRSRRVRERGSFSAAARRLLMGG
jgi:hypothetical protein